MSISKDGPKALKQDKSDGKESQLSGTEVGAQYRLHKVRFHKLKPP